MGMGHKIAIPALAGMLLFTGATGASAAPNDGNTIEQSKVVETSPRSLDFVDVIPGIPQTKSITVTNVSGKDISIYPQMDVSEEYSEFLETDLHICDDSNNCVAVTPELEIDIPAGGSEELAVTINQISKPPAHLMKITLSGGIKVTGTVYPDSPNEEVLEIIPETAEEIAAAEDEKEKKGSLASTGVGEMLIKFATWGGALMILGYIVLTVARKRDNPPVDAE